MKECKPGVWNIPSLPATGGGSSSQWLSSETTATTTNNVHGFASKHQPFECGLIELNPQSMEANSRAILLQIIEKRKQTNSTALLESSSSDRSSFTLLFNTNDIANGNNSGRVDSVWPGDEVEFNIVVEKRGGMLSASDIRLVKPKDYPREFGVVSSVKSSFGFIKSSDREEEVYFHFSEVLFPDVSAEKLKLRHHEEHSQPRQELTSNSNVILSSDNTNGSLDGSSPLSWSLKELQSFVRPGTEVEFSSAKSNWFRKPIAIRIRLLPKRIGGMKVG